MTITTLFFIALGLSMDAFAVTLSNGMVYGGSKKSTLNVAPLMFGVFQGLMPFIGFILGKAFSEYITRFDHWIAFALLTYIGGSMILATFKKDTEIEIQKNVLTFNQLIVQSIATSIDALAIGVSFALLDVNIIYACAFIGVTTFVLCMAGIWLGKYIGKFLKSKAELIGGIVLVGIGLKILLEHTIFA
ncbi:MAG: manganese efflux pump MntP family protein [Oscillospiraceae bacterium]